MILHFGQAQAGLGFLHIYHTRLASRCGGRASFLGVDSLFVFAVFILLQAGAALMSFMCQIRILVGLVWGVEVVFLSLVRIPRLHKRHFISQVRKVESYWAVILKQGAKGKCGKKGRDINSLCLRWKYGLEGQRGELRVATCLAG
jgi:hypothetical protein